MLNSVWISVFVVCVSVRPGCGAVNAVNASVRINKCCEPDEVLVAGTCAAANGTGEWTHKTKWNVGVFAGY